MRRRRLQGIGNCNLRAKFLRGLPRVQENNKKGGNEGREEELAAKPEAIKLSAVNPFSIRGTLEDKGSERGTNRKRGRGGQGLAIETAFVFTKDEGLLAR